MKIYIKAFISGFSFVSFVVTFIVLIAQSTSNINLLVSEITLAALIFGVWNMIYFFIRGRGVRIPIGIWGALLGLLFGLSTLLRSEIHIGHSESILILLDNFFNFETFDFFFHTLSIIWLPALYFLLWHFVIRWLNNLWDCKC